MLTVSLVFFIFGSLPLLVQKYYGDWIYPIIATDLRFIFYFYPFPAGELIYCIYTLSFLGAFYSIISKGIKKDMIGLQIASIRFINLTLSSYVLFELFWGLNYSRPPVHQQLNIPYTKYTQDELIALTRFFIQRSDSLEKLIDFKPRYGPKPEQKRYTLKALRDDAAAAYAENPSGSRLFVYKIPSIKPGFLFLSQFGIEGYYNPFTGEAQVNLDLPEWILPFVTCHEIAHQQGIAREDEANLIGYMAAAQSSNVNFQYSAYYNMLHYLLYEVQVNAPERYEALFKTISPGVKQHFKEERAFWEENNIMMSRYLNIAFDNFLKFNGQSKGIESYRDIVIWLWNMHKKDIHSTLQPVNNNTPQKS